ncbi:MAG: hypothetical protein H0T80_16715 [Betaproteobacteria bacterium]|nr:hypothetical protein [Betaproteobacteria bacterium]
MIQLILEQCVGVGADAKAIADDCVRAWERVAAQFAPVIGEGGVGALYARSLHLTRSKFPWLAAPEEARQSDSPSNALRVSLERRDPSEAKEAISVLLVTFAELLTALIGETLTTRILSSANGGPDDTAQETLSNE